MRQEYKTTLNVPWMFGDSLKQTNRLFLGEYAEADAYSKIPLIYRAINLRVDALLRVPVYVYEGDALVSKTNVGDGFYFEKYMFTPLLKGSLRNLLSLCEVAFLLKGAAYVLKLRNRFGLNTGLQWLNPFTMRTKVIRDARDLPTLTFWQELKEGGRFPKTGEWKLDDLLYFRDFNPFDDLGPAVSATNVALGDAQILGSVTTFLGNFFSADALPITMAILPVGTNVTERDRVENFFRKKILDLRHAASRVLGVAGEVKLEKLTSELNTFDFDKIDVHAFQGVSDAFGMPQSLLRSGSGANRSISDNERESFLNDTIIPRTKFYENILNPYLDQFGQQIRFAHEELPEMQTNEFRRSQSLKLIVDSGVPLLAALDMLGYGLSDEAESLIEESVKKAESKPQGMTPLAGSELPKTPTSIPVQEDNEPPVKAIVKEVLTEQKIQGEIANWFSKASRNLKQGKSPLVEFESSVIPEEVQSQVIEVLEAKVWMDSLKIGARNNAEDSLRIQKIHDMAASLGATHKGQHGAWSPLLQNIHDHSVTLGADCEGSKKAGEDMIINVTNNMGDLGDKLNEALKAMREPQAINIQIPEQPAPVVNVTVPESTVQVNVPEQKSDIHITVPENVINIPQQPAPTVNVSMNGELGEGLIEAMKEVKLVAPPAEVTVMIPEQVAPVVNVTVPTSAPPNVFINTPEPKEKDIIVERDAQGRIKKLKTKE